MFSKNISKTSFFPKTQKNMILLRNFIFSDYFSERTKFHVHINRFQFVIRIRNFRVSIVSMVK